MVLPLPSGPLDVDANIADYAVGLAYVGHLENEAAALELLAIDRAAWASAVTWPLRVADAIDRGEWDLAKAFGAAFQETQALLRASSADAELVASAEEPRPRALGGGVIARLSDEAAAHPPPPLAAPPPASTGTPSALQDHVEPGPAADLDQTTEAAVRSRDPATLPFHRAPGPSAYAAAKAAGTAVGAPAAPAAEPGDLDKTLEASLAPLRPPLPFSTALEGGDPLDTALSIEVLRPPGLELPFRAPPTMSVEQYASLSVNLEVFPERRDVILSTYGVGNAAHLDAVRAAFSETFGRDPAVKEAFARRVSEIRARLAKV